MLVQLEVWTLCLTFWSKCRSLCRLASHSTGRLDRLRQIQYHMHVSCSHPHFICAYCLCFHHGFNHMTFKPKIILSAFCTITSFWFTMSSGGPSELVLFFCRKLRRYFFHGNRQRELWRYFLGLLGSGLCDKSLFWGIFCYIYLKMPLLHIHVDTAIKSFISVTLCMQRVARFYCL